MRKKTGTIEDDFVRNTAGISAVEMMWGFGLPVVIDSAFLQIFMRKSGASNFEIGLIPTIFFIGTSVFPLFSSFLTTRVKLKRNAVTLTHIVSSLSMLLFGTFLLLFGTPSNTIIAFFISYSVFSISIGLTLPVWMNFLVKIFSPRQNVKALSVMMISQNLAKILASLALTEMVEKFAFSLRASGSIFIAVGIVFFVGSFGFLIVREEPDIIQEKKDKFFGHLFQSFKLTLKNRNFLIYLGNDLEFYAVVGVLAFYANFATEYESINPAIASGYFVGFSYLGSTLSNIFFGLIGALSLKSKCYFSKLMSLSAILILIFSPTLWGFFAASTLLGAARSLRIMLFPPIIKLISGLNDATSYFAFAPLIMLPFSVGMSIASGQFLDSFTYLGADSYRILFAALGGLILVSIGPLTKVDFSSANS